MPDSSVPLAVLSAFFALCCTLCFLYPNRSVGTKRRNDLPGPKGLPLIGNLVQMFSHRKRMLMHLADLESEYGELFSFTMLGWGRNIVINRPEWLAHVKKRDTTVYGKGPVELAIFGEFPGRKSSFGSEGEEWRYSRRIIQPIFTTKNFENNVSRVMDEIIPIATRLLSALAKSSQVFDFNSFCGRIALLIFCKTALSLDADLLSPDPACLDISNKMMDAVYVLNSISSGRLYNPFWSFTEKFDGTETMFTNARNEIIQIVDKIVKERKEARLQNPVAHEDDFLSALLSNPRLTDIVFLRDTLVTLLFAGRDNTQNVLSWSLHELSTHPEWMKRMREEAMAHSVEGQAVRYSEISKYPVHLAVFYETLRLWPGVPKNARLAMADDVLPAIPELGYPEIPVHKGDYVLWSDYSMMRNKTVWGEDANSFNPGRHLSDEGQFMKPANPKFHSFGAGPRLCPGAQLSAYEFVAIWVAFLPSFQFEPTELKQRYPLDAFTMSMSEPFMIHVSEYSSEPSARKSMY